VVPRLVGINHVAVQVGDLDEALLSARRGPRRRLCSLAGRPTDQSTTPVG
jgi:hypothetical protein